MNEVQLGEALCWNLSCNRSCFVAKANDAEHDCGQPQLTRAKIEELSLGAFHKSLNTSINKIFKQTKSYINLCGVVGLLESNLIVSQIQVSTCHVTDLALSH